MLIKEIELNNFRIYKGKNTINILPSDNQNIIVVSGKNGFGKTTFLMSLVWCLYGKQMDKVDELYYKEISDKGGYAKYIANSLNRLAKVEGETKFSVSVTFTDVKIPEITCNEVKITRVYDTATNSGKIEVLIDGFPNNLINDLTTDGKQDGEENFIREFILPIEIAKFFFFDAEKIVSLAEVNSLEQRKNLSKAYTEVLGIKKYEDLKENLEKRQDEYRKNSATTEKKQELNKTQLEIENHQLRVDDFESKKEELDKEKIERQGELTEIQIKLVKEGGAMSQEELNRLKEAEKNDTENINSLQNQLKDLYDFIPFGLAGERLMEVSQQLDNEKNYKENKYKQENVSEKTDAILNDLEQEKKNFNGVIDTKIRDFYEKQFKELIKKYFYADIPELPVNFSPLHDFSEVEYNTIKVLIDNLIHSFRENFSRLNEEYSKVKYSLETTRRKIQKAEANTEEPYIAELRQKRDKLENRISVIDQEIGSLDQQIRNTKDNIKTNKQKQTDLRKELDKALQYSELSDKYLSLIEDLKKVIRNFKIETKQKLEANILENLDSLMHKKEFIKRVEVDINQEGDDVDINLFNSRNEKIDKVSLSMGERQMYASALLKALVDESDIEFPVFIDSPMQKFDGDHSKNIIKEFYPNVSKQVVLFPLIETELTESNFPILKPNVCKTYLIHNQSMDKSEFIETTPENLIKTYNEKYAN